jgi:hypothetical protein
MIRSARPTHAEVSLAELSLEIAICDDLVQGAIICGDDWLWCDGRCHRSQQPVGESARRRRRALGCVSNTWLIDDCPWTVAERMIWRRGLPQSVSRRLTAWARARRG